MVHQYKLNGYNIVLDTCSGSIHSVDEVAYDIIAMVAENKTEAEITAEMLKKYSDITEADVKECLEDVDALKEAKNSLPLIHMNIWLSISRQEIQ